MKQKISSARKLWNWIRGVKSERLYDAAKNTRLNSRWTNHPTSANYELRLSLRTMRARAREGARNNGRLKKYLGMARTNIVGHKGIQLQVRAMLPDGQTLNTDLNKKVELAFWEWSHRENCTASGKMNFIDAQNLCVTHLKRDGEVLIQKIRGFDNKFGFALKFIDVSYLDEYFNENLHNGNRVVMSVEYDRHDKPVAYYLTTPSGELYTGAPERMDRVRVPASEMMHIFQIKDDESQARGVTEFHTVLIDAKNSKGYRDGVIMQARVAANTMGFIVPNENVPPEFDGTDSAGETIEIDSAPLVWNLLPAGYKTEQFDPKQPTQQHAEFSKTLARDEASSLDVTYHGLTGDLESVNYSTARVALLDERSSWRMDQQFIIDHFCREVYHAWLDEAILSGALRVSMRDYKEIKDPMWRPRGWEWIDPQKEVNAFVVALANKLTTWTDVLGAQGIDLTEHLTTLQNEQKEAEKFGVSLEVISKTSASTAPAKEEEDNPDDEKPKPKREFTNGGGAKVLN